MKSVLTFIELNSVRLKLLPLLLILSTLFVGCNGARQGGKERQINPQPVVTPLTLSPSTFLMELGGYSEFVAAGGYGNYVFSIEAGLGEIIPSTSGTLLRYAASNSQAGLVTIKVTSTSSSGTQLVARSAVQVFAPLTLTPSSVQMNYGETRSFSTTGISSPVTYSIVGAPNGASINSLTGIFTAPPSGTGALTFTLKVLESDGLKRSKTAQILVAPPLSLNKTNIVLKQSAVETLTISGGVAPYSATLNPPTAGTVTVTQNSISLTTKASITAAETATLTVRDSAPQTATVNLALKPPIVINPSSIALLQGMDYTFTSTGGDGTQVYSLRGSYGSAQLNTQTGVLRTPTALTTALNFQVRVTDGLGQFSESAVRVDPQFVSNPPQATLLSGQIQTFNFLGGASPYLFSIPAGMGSLSTDSGVQVSYTAPSPIVSSTAIPLTVRDSLQRQFSVMIYLKGPIQITEPITNLKQNSTYTVRATGGDGNFRFSLQGNANNCQINATTGELRTPPAVTQEFTIVVRASDPNIPALFADRTYWVRTPLTLPQNTLSLGYSETNTTFLNGSTNPSGGEKPYTYTVLSGGSYAELTKNTQTEGATILSRASTGDLQFEVADHLGQKATGTVSVARQLELDPTSAVLAKLQQQSFTPSGGRAPYRFRVLGTGSGSIDSQGLYTAPNTQGRYTIEVTDSTLPVSRVAVATVQVGVGISPKTISISSNKSVTFRPVGGRAPFKYTVPNNNPVGSINATSGVFTAKSNASGTVQVTIQDLNGSGDSDTATVTVAPILVLAANKIDYRVSDTGLLTAAGGAKPYTFSKVSGPGTLSPKGDSQLEFRAEAPTGTFTSQVETQIKVTDASQQEKIIKLYTYPAPLMTSNVSNLAANQTATLTTTRGKGPFTYALNPSVNPGSVTATSSGATYNSPQMINANSSVLVEVTDSLGSKFTLSLNLYAPFNVTTRYVLAPGTLTPTIAPIGGLAPFSFVRISGDTTNVGFMDTTRSLFVAQPWQSGVVVYDLKDSLNQTKRLTFNVLPRILPQPTPLALLHPTGITSDASGKIYVADNFNHRIVKYSESGVFERSFGSSGSEPGKLSNPFGIVASSNGNLYVSDYGNHRISIFNSSGGYVSSFGSEGSQTGQFKFPRGLTFDSGGNLYVADSGNNRIQKFSPSHTYLASFGSLGEAVGQLASPKSVFIYNQLLFITDTQRITRVNLSDNSVSSFGDYGLTFNSPSSMTANAAGDIISLERTSHRLVLFKPDQTVSFSLGQRGNLYGQFDAPEFIHRLAEGPMLIADSNNNRIEVLAQVSRRSELQRGESLQMGQRLFPPSPTVNCQAFLSYDGRYIVYKDGAAARCSRGTGTNHFQIFQTDGNSVVYNYSKGVINQTRTENKGAVNFKFTDSCNTVISKADGTPLWSSDNNMQPCP